MRPRAQGLAPQVDGAPLVHHLPESRPDIVQVQVSSGLCILIVDEVVTLKGPQRRLSVEELLLSNCGAGEDS